MRTTRSNWRSPWITWVAAVPPIAVSISVFTSLDVQPVPRQLFPVRRDRQAGLPQLPHHRDLGDARNLLQDALHLCGLLVQNLQVRAEDLHRQRTLQAGLRFIHGVLGGLRVVEDDPRECGELLLNGFDQLRLGVDRSLPRAVAVGLQADVEFVVVKAGGIRPVVRPPQFVGHGRDLRKAQQDVADLGSQLGGLLEGNRVGRRGPHPQRAFIQVRHELSADPRDQQQRAAEHQQHREHRSQPVAQAPAQNRAVGVAHFFI